MILNRLIVSFVVATLAFGQEDPFTGLYENTDLRLELRATGAGAYVGSLTFQGQSFPVSAKPRAGGIAGTFTSGGDSFAFTASASAGELRLVTDGTGYVLRRAGEAAVHPLRPASTPAVSARGARCRHSLGVGFTLAPGWTAKDSPEGIIILPAGAVIDPTINTNPEVYIAGKQDGFNPAEEREFVQSVSQTFLKGGGQLRRADRVSLGIGTAYYWEVYDPETRREAGFSLYLRPAGQSAYLVIAVGLANRIRSRDAELRQMLASMDFQAPRMDAGGPLADATPLARQWLQKLSGRMIRQMWASQGMSSDQRHYLRADGTYLYTSSSMVSINVGPYGGAPDASALSTGRDCSTGRWRIRDLGGQVALQVQYANGETRLFRITQDERNWYLDGEKAFAVDPE